MAIDFNFWKSKLLSKEYNQSHLLESKDEETSKKIIEQVDAVDHHYPGGLISYLNNARKLLADSKAGVNPFDGFEPLEPAAVKPEIGSEEFFKLEEIGLNEVAHCAFVLVAGGLGERLGYSDIKIGLCTNITDQMTYMEYYTACIRSYEDYCSKAFGGKKVTLPLAIMTSGDTYERTVRLLEKNDYFHITKEQVAIMLQEKVPALTDNAGHMGIKGGDTLELKPHGHGDVHTLLHQHNLPAKWIEQGIRWMFVFQDTNAGSFRSLPTMLAVSKNNDFKMNSLTIPRVPGEAVGAICHLVNRTTGEDYTLNVEYNVLGPLLKTCGMGGDVAAEGTKFSKYPGNCNILTFELAAYKAVLDKTKGAVPEFVNPKYADASKDVFKSATRVECMMQEFARLFSKEQKVGCTVLDRWFCFSTVKNNVAEGASKYANGLPTETAFSAECEYYEASVEMLKLGGKRANVEVIIPKGPATKMHGMELPMGPRVVVRPCYGVCPTMISKRLEGSKSIKISERSSLVLGGNVKFESLDIDGNAWIDGGLDSSSEIRIGGHVSFKTQPAELEEVDLNDESIELMYRVRGYRLKKGSGGCCKINC